MSMVADVLFSEGEARKLTDEVKQDARSMWAKLLRLNRGAAHTALGYTSWHEYCAEEFDLGKSRAYQMLEAAERVEALADSTMVESAPLPESERVARELPKDPEAARETWRATVEQHGDRPTARQVAETREAIKAPPVDEPDDTQKAIIESKRAEGGDELAESYAASMGVRCPAPPTELPAGDVVDLGAHKTKVAAQNVKRLRNVVSTCRAIREVADGGWDIDGLVASTDDRELRQAVKDIHAAKRELALIEKHLTARLKESA